MRKDIHHMTDHELLLELVAEKRRLEDLRRVRLIVTLIVLAAVILLAVIYIPRILAPIREFQQNMDELKRSLDRFNSSLQQMDEMTSEARAFFQQVGDLGLEKMQQSVEQLSEALGRVTGFFHLP